MNSSISQTSADVSSSSLVYNTLFMHFCKSNQFCSPDNQSLEGVGLKSPTVYVCLGRGGSEVTYCIYMYIKEGVGLKTPTVY